MSFSITTYLIAGAAAAFVFLFWLMNYYKAKSKQLERDVDHAMIAIKSLQKELASVQLKQDIQRDNARLSPSELDERMREKGYFRNE